ncbi:MAG: hypothetical protein R6X33_11290 [Candidatus Brocadiia bacterium]
MKIRCECTKAGKRCRREATHAFRERGPDGRQKHFYFCERHRRLAEDQAEQRDGIDPARIDKADGTRSVSVIPVGEVSGIINPTDPVPCQRRPCCEWLLDALPGRLDWQQPEQCPGNNDAAQEYAFDHHETGHAVFDLCAGCGKAVYDSLRAAGAIASAQQDGATIRVVLAK